jgi:IS605 OrfB family transposase
LASLGLKEKITIPVKNSAHLNELKKVGKMKGGIRLSKKFITVMFEIPVEPANEANLTLGIDLGIDKVITCSNGFVAGKDIHGHDSKSIAEKLCRKKWGSKGYKKAVEHRKNYFNRQLNLLNISQFSSINIEDIKYLRHNKKTSKLLKRFIYGEIRDKIEMKAERYGVHVKAINPTYTSQRCAECGWTRKSNRRGSLFKCGKCGNTCDSDLNAATNIELGLTPIKRKQRLMELNRNGFYWDTDKVRCGNNIQSREPIVPDCPKVEDFS